MALPRPRLRTQYIGQKRFRRAVTMQNVVFTALFEIHHELDGDPRIAGPAWMGRVPPIAVEIAGVPGFGHLHSLEADFLRALPQHGLSQSRQTLKV